VQLSEHLPGVLVERVHDVLVGGVRPGRIGFGSCWCELRDDSSSGGQIRKARFALGQSSSEVLDLTAEFRGPGGGLVVLGLEAGEESDDVHAASPRVSRQVGLGVVRRRVMFAVEAQ
jgi:hypothetical protein